MDDAYRYVDFDIVSDSVDLFFFLKCILHLRLKLTVFRQVSVVSETDLKYHAKIGFHF